ncbi:MAG: YveK family protein [Bulleidia sp.]
MNAGNKNLNVMDEDVIDLKELFLALKNRWKLIIVVTFVTTIISSVYTFCFTTPMYSAEATIYIQGSDGSTVSELMQGLQLGAQLAPDYEVFFKSRPVVRNVIKSQNLDMTVEELNAQVTISNPTDTHMIVVKVTDSDPQRAADIANAYIEYGIDAVREVVVKEPYVVESAIADDRKVSPSNTKNILMGMLIGIVLSGGYVVARTLLDDKLNSNDKIERVLGYNVLASFKEDSSLKMVREEKKKKGKRK